jgi:hypothetical protein
MKSDFEFFVHATLRRSYTDAMTTEPIPSWEQLQPSGTRTAVSTVMRDCEAVLVATARQSAHPPHLVLPVARLRYGNPSQFLFRDSCTLTNGCAVLHQARNRRVP